MRREPAVPTALDDQHLCPRPSHRTRVLTSSAATLGVRKRSHAFRARWGLAFCWIVITGALLPATRTGFAPYDDWFILAGALGEAAPPQLRAEGIEFSWPALVSADFFSLGRFRPAYWAIQCVEFRLFASDPRAWHLGSLFCALIVATALFRALIGAGISPAAAIAGVLASVLARPAIVWLHTSNAELWGTTFVAGALWALVRAAKAPRSRMWDGAALGLLAMAGLCKESFLLVMLAALVIRLALSLLVFGSESRRRDVVALAIAYSVTFVVLGVCIAAALEAAGSGSYGGISVTSPGDGMVARIGSMGLTAVADSSYLAPVVLLATAAAVRRSTGPRVMEWVAVGGIALLWVCPQLALYGTRPVVWDYYYYPLTIAPAFVNAWALSRAGDLRLRWLTAALAGIISVSIYFSWRSVAQEAARRKASVHALDTVVKRAARVLPVGGSLIVAGGLVELGEPGFRLLGGLGAVGRRDVHVIWMKTREAPPVFSAPWVRSWLGRSSSWTSVAPQLIGGACFVGHASATEVQRVAEIAADLSLERQDVREDWQVWSWRRLGWTKRTEAYTCWFTHPSG